ncbi:MAG: YigZ family protein [Streptococcaceae bacterium]|nr:YigZ family protein [Streptococcaceae bacterium]MCL2681020.1 YigZ family protein [Streptococcaceae bacterium]
MTIIIKKNIIFEEEIKKSRFICHLKRVENEEEARAFITSIKKEHHKANHNCSAYVLGDKAQIQRMSDDGEPSGTAGVPMLEILKKKRVVNICAVVTRYFGGVKLGAGGLIRAYAGAVNHAIEEVGLVELVEQSQLILTLDYGLFDSLNRWLTNQDSVLADSQFSDKVKAELYVDTDKIAEFANQLREQFNNQIAVEKGQKQFVEVEYKERD